MISSEVQRTLVKSPPELWTELSDPASLGRHLGDFGEIRITRVEPEKTVEWEAENTSGTVSIKPSGWGTRVILKATREMPAPEPSAAPGPPAAPEPSAAPEPPAAPKPPISPEPDIAAQAGEAEAQQAAGAEAQPEAQAEPEPEAPGELEAAAAIDESWPAEPAHWQASEIYPEPLADELGDWEEPGWESDEQAETEPRRGFLARLFGWRRREKPAEQASPPPADETPDSMITLPVPISVARGATRIVNSRVIKGCSSRQPPPNSSRIDRSTARTCLVSAPTEM